MRKIEKSFEKYHELEEKYYETVNEYILINYLKKVCVYLKECKEIEILSDDIDLFRKRFFHIDKFENNLVNLNRGLLIPIIYDGEKKMYSYFNGEKVDVRLVKIILKVSYFMFLKIFKNLI